MDFVDPSRDQFAPFRVGYKCFSGASKCVAEKAAVAGFRKPVACGIPADFQRTVDGKHRNSYQWQAMSAQSASYRPWFLALMALLLGFRAVIGCEAAHAAPPTTTSSSHCDEMALADSTANAGHEAPAPDDGLAKQHDCASTCHAMAFLMSHPLVTPALPKPQLAMPMLTSLDGSSIPPATPPPRTA